MLVKEREQKPLLGSEVMVKRPLGTAGALTDEIERSGVVAALREDVSRCLEQTASRLGSPLRLCASLNFHTMWYICTNQYESIEMAEAGLTLVSPKIGQTITFVRTSKDTDGAELVIEALMRPGAFMPPHVHLHQEERFDVLEGVGTFRVKRRQVTAGPGGEVFIPAGTAHRFRNRSDADVRIRATLRPALRTEDLFERLFRLGSEGRVNRLGAPRPWVTAALIREFHDEFFYLAGVPVGLQRLLAGTRP